MVMMLRTMECHPVPLRIGDMDIAPAPPPNHSACAVKHTIDGVIGGWMCSCWCHQEARKNMKTTPVIGENGDVGVAVAGAGLAMFKDYEICNSYGMVNLIPWEGDDPAGIEVTVEVHFYIKPKGGEG